MRYCSKNTASLLPNCYLSALFSAMTYLKAFFLILALSPALCFAQKKPTVVSGKLLDEDNQPLKNAAVRLLGSNRATATNDTGYFRLQVPANKAVALQFTYTGFLLSQRNFLLNEGEQEYIIVRMKRGERQLQDVTVTGRQGRRDAGEVTIDASAALNNPSPITGIESLIKIFVGSNNELTSQYSVRGGSYDENLIYVNDFEIFRPYLVRSGQQEGLSFINPEMTGNVRFYNGGFQAKYGDKLSSVLDITYKKPRKTGGSAYVSLLEQGVHLEGAGKRFTYLLGLRNRSNRNLLSSQETQGSYIPSSSDVQALLTYKLSPRWQAEFLGNVSGTRFTLYPEESKLTSGVFSPLFSANLGLDIFFEGQERDQYSSNFQGLSFINQPHKNLQLKYMLSHFGNNESENIDIAGAYLFGERDFDQSAATFGAIINPLGAGVFHNYARNRLNIDVYNLSHKGSYTRRNHFIQWGLTGERQYITDKLHEWEYNDSAGYSLPHSGSAQMMFKSMRGKANLTVNRFSGYLQDNIKWNDSSGFTMQPGVRFNYNDLNKEFLISPRLNFSYSNKRWTRDIILKGAVGMYVQPPFYREMRRYDGTLNTNLRAQKSYQASVGMDYNFKMFQRPARITSEVYYKHMTDVVPFDIDNVRLRYHGENNAKAWAAGFEARLYGELVKDAESWISFSFMRTKEDLANDYFTRYYNKAGEEIGPKTQDQVPADSVASQVGWLRRPTDRAITFGMFFQDYLSTNKNFKVYLNLLYGSNLPYNIPGSTRYRNALTIEPYIRADVGFSALLIDPQKQNRRSRSPFRNFESIWASVEVFNLIDRANTISYLLIKDFSNSTYTMPNRLTPRLINLKIAARW